MNVLFVDIGYEKMFINIRHNCALQENSKKVSCEQLLCTWTEGNLGYPTISFIVISKFSFREDLCLKNNSADFLANC